MPKRFASIRVKMLVLFGLGLGCVACAAVYGFAAARGGLETIGRVNDTLLAQSIDTQAMESAFKEQVQSWMSVLLRGHDSEALDRSWKQFIFREREVRRDAARLRKSIDHPEARELMGQFAAAHEALGERLREALEAFSASGFDARRIDAELKGIDRKPSELIERIVALMREEAQTAIAQARADAMRKLVISLGVIAAATLAALLACSALLLRAVAQPLAYALRVTESVAQGDLTVAVKVSSRDETGRLLEGLREMSGGLAGAVTQIRRAADEVGAASREIAAGHANLASRTEQAASNIEETASSMEELASAVKRNASQAREAGDLAAGASATAVRGGEAMGAVADTMNSIADSSRRIEDIVGLIDGIAFQTNILALNAAVEAARAGEQGRGFAVVAAEVRGLAQRSAAAAKEVKGLIQSAAERVGNGTQLVERAARTMDEIVAGVKRVSGVMAEIGAASEEQLAGIEQVNRAVQQMDRVVQENAALVEESSAAAESLGRQAGQLVAAVERFRTSDAQDEPGIPDTPDAPNSASPPPHVQVAHAVDEGCTEKPADRAARDAASTVVPIARRRATLAQIPR